MLAGGGLSGPQLGGGHRTEPGHDPVGAEALTGAVDESIHGEAAHYYAGEGHTFWI
jgi:hypothetical protein